MAPTITILQAQALAIGNLASQHGGAFGLSQTGPVIHVDTGEVKFDIGPNGHFLPPSKQE
jgi:hypothetical protein